MVLRMPKLSNGRRMSSLMMTMEMIMRLPELSFKLGSQKKGGGEESKNEATDDVTLVYEDDKETQLILMLMKPTDVLVDGGNNIQLVA